MFDIISFLRPFTTNDRGGTTIHSSSFGVTSYPNTGARSLSLTYNVIGGINRSLVLTMNLIGGMIRSVISTILEKLIG